MVMDQERVSEPVLPLALLTRGRLCLVVGAGKTGCRKAQALLEAGARVVLVAPTGGEEAAQLAGQANLEWRQRLFQPSDAEGVFLAFAATDDEQANGAVLAACRDRAVLCGIVDHGWRHGDFISPAVLRQDGLCIAVSTGGRSCRRARMVKEALGRHLEAVDAADLLVIGVDHRRLGLAEREALHLDSAAKERLGAMLRQVMALHGFAVVETCNRIELHAVVSAGTEIEEILRRLLGFNHLPADQVYCLRGHEAFQHSALLLAGLLSQVIGEKHIVAQVKQAFDEAERMGWANGMLREWLDSSLHVAKHIRQETVDSTPAFEIEDITLDFLAAQGDADAAEPGVMVIGSGAMGRALATRWLERTSRSRLVWVYRSRPPEVPSAWEARVETAQLAALDRLLPRMRAVICATAADRPVLDQSHARLFGESPVHIVDLGVPRNVSPELARACPQVQVQNLDGLKQWQRCEGRDADAFAPTARRIVGEHRDMYDKLTMFHTGA